MARLTQVAATFLRVTFARESLPPAPPPPPRSTRRSLLSLLLAPDELPGDLPPLPRRRSPWLAWFFAPERIDD